MKQQGGATASDFLMARILPGMKLKPRIFVICP
jgi:hypothetical protein